MKHRLTLLLWLLAVAIWLTGCTSATSARTELRPTPPESPATALASNSTVAASVSAASAETPEVRRTATTGSQADAPTSLPPETALAATPTVQGRALHEQDCRPSEKVRRNSCALQALREAAGNTRMVPLTDLGRGLYLGFEGGLYPGGSNEMPTAHAAEGLRRARMIQPLDANGNPDPSGKIVLLSVGMSNTTQEFCFNNQARTSCNPWTFVGLSDNDPSVNHGTLMAVDGARGGQVADHWDTPDKENYARVRDDVLADLGLSEQQVQIVWLKAVNFVRQQPSLPHEEGDAYTLMATLADVVRSLKVRYPNLQQIFISSRIYAGYALEGTPHPEPYAYETGFAVKWLIEAQIRQMESAGREVNPLTGDLDYGTVAPWLAWGPYLWADGTNPRSDGLVWLPEDFREGDMTHPSDSGSEKVARLLLDFFKSSPYSRCWFLAGMACE